MHDLLGNKLFCLPSAILPSTSSELSVRSSQFFLVGNFSCELNEVKEYPANFPPFDFTVLCFMANEKTSIVFVLWTDSKNESGISSPGALLSRFQHFPQF